MEQGTSVNLDRILSLMGIAISIVLSLTIRTPTSAAFFLVLLFGVLLHPALAVAAAYRVRPSIASFALAVAVAFFGYLVWPSSNEHFPTARENARDGATGIARRDESKTITRLPPDVSLVLSKPSLSSGVVASQAKIGFRSKGSAAPLWNLFGNRPGLIRVSNSHADPHCLACWSPEVNVWPGEHVFVETHFENNGSRTARDVRLHLDVPSDPLSGSLVFGTLAGLHAGVAQGAACIFTPNVPLLLLPVRGEWYPNESSHPLPLPYEQSATAVTSSRGLQLGDVGTGKPFVSDAVFEFEAVGVTVIAFRDVSVIARRFLPEILASGGSFDVEKISQALSKVVHVSDGDFEYDGNMQRGWASNLNSLRVGEQIALCIFTLNGHAETLHDAKLLVRERKGEHRLSIKVVSRETAWEIATPHLSYLTGASSLHYLASYDWPFGFCPVGTKTVADMYKLARAGNPADGIELGELAPQQASISAVVFEVR